MISVTMLSAMATLAAATTGVAVNKPTVPTKTLSNGVMMPAMLWGSGGSTQENATSTQSVHFSPSFVGHFLHDMHQD
jgi:hypothetical protein